MITLNLIDPDFLHVLFLFFFIASLFSLLVGLGLLFKARWMGNCIGTMNRWISLRRMLKPLEVPRDIDSLILKRRWLTGSLTVAIATGTLAILLNLPSEAFLVVTHESLPELARLTLASSLHWLLLIGNVLCIGIGGLILLRPQWLSALERWANRWISTRQHMRPLDTMRHDLDHWALHHPTSIGGMIVILSLSVAIMSYLQL